jgi:hypothetical protein
MEFTRQYEALQTELTNFKTELTTSISTQLSNVYVPAPATSSSYAAVAQLSAPGIPTQRSLPLSQPRNLASNSTSRASVMSDTPYYTIDTSGVNENKQQEVQPGAIRAAIEKRFAPKKGVTGGVQQL